MLFNMYGIYTNSQTYIDGTTGGHYYRAMACHDIICLKPALDIDSIKHLCYTTYN